MTPQKPGKHWGKGRTLEEALKEAEKTITQKPGWYEVEIHVRYENPLSGYHVELSPSN